MINNYELGQKLGEGITGEVRLATDTDNGRKCALKIFKNNSRMLTNECTYHSQLNHENIVSLTDVRERAKLTDENGVKSNVGYIATELVPRGEIFDFLANKPALPMPVVKYYAQQLIKGIQHMHGRDIAHRDLKCENILVDADYNLKIADLGFACSIQGKTGNGFNTQCVGTVQYMAPELLGKRPYQPQVVDWYAFGVILFMLGSGHAPFTKADLNDPHFFCIAKGDMKRFWRAHEQNMSEGFSEEFKDLISSMLAYQPFQRLSTADIVFHPFFTNGGCATQDQVRQVMSQREA